MSTRASARNKTSMPPPPIAKSGVREITSEPFDQSKKDGLYEIDAFAKRIEWRSDWMGPTMVEPGSYDFRFLRHLVAQVGHRAREYASADELAAERHAEAKRYKKQLADLQARARRIAQRNVDDLEFEFMQPPESISEDSREAKDAMEDARADAGRALDEVARLSAELAIAIENVHQAFPISPPRGTGNKSPLIHRFVWFFALHWEIWTGAKPPRSRDCLFVDTMAAAWRSLGFPELNDAEVVLGRVNERR